MSAVDIKKTVRRVLVSVFVVAEVLVVGGLYVVLRQQGLQDAERQSRLILASAKALRDYTSTQIAAVADSAPDLKFHEITVPSFAAQTVFRHVGGSDSGYTYRESALNPTNPQDRSTPFEVDLVRRFQDRKDLAELTGLTTAGGGSAFYVARPFRISDPRCLACHSTPAAAPPAMLAKYGSSNGFNWTMGDTVGVQLLTIPVAMQFQGVLRLVALLSGGLMLVFTAAYFALSRALDATVVGPLRALTAAADQASRTPDAAPDPPHGGAQEIIDLTGAIERLRCSLHKALERLGEQRSTP